MHCKEEFIKQVLPKLLRPTFIALGPAVNSLSPKAGTDSSPLPARLRSDNCFFNICTRGDWAINCELSWIRASLVGKKASPQLATGGLDTLFGESAVEGDWGDPTDYLNSRRQGLFVRTYEE